MSNSLSIESFLNNARYEDNNQISRHLRPYANEINNVTSLEEIDSVLASIQDSINKDETGLRIHEHYRLVSKRLTAAAHESRESQEVMQIIADFSRTTEAADTDEEVKGADTPAVTEKKKNFFAKIWDAIKKIFKKIAMFIQYMINGMIMWFRKVLQGHQSKMYANKDKIFEALKDASKKDLRAKVLAGPDEAKPLNPKASTLAGSMLKGFADACVQFENTAKTSLDALKGCFHKGSAETAKPSIWKLHIMFGNTVKCIVTTAKSNSAINNLKATADDAAKAFGDSDMTVKNAVNNAFFNGQSNKKDVLIRSYVTADSFELLNPKFIDELGKVVKAAKQSKGNADKAIDLCTACIKEISSLNSMDSKGKTKALGEITESMKQVRVYTSKMPKMTMTVFSSVMNMRTSVFNACKVLIKGEAVSKPKKGKGKTDDSSEKSK